MNPSISQDGKKALISFADSRLSRSAFRLERQARALGTFDSIRIYSERDLDDEFEKSVGVSIESSTRGFGFWVWKPYLILERLRSLEENDILLYLDVGCHLNPSGIHRLNEYFQFAADSSTGLLCFQATPPVESPKWDGRWLPTFPDAQWAKGDLLDFFGVRDRPDIVETPTIGAGIIFIRNCEPARTIVQSWLRVMVDNPGLVDDSSSKSPNHPWFLEHRHDQSVFSIIAKKNQVSSVSAFEYWYPSIRSRKADWAALSDRPIHAKRDLDFGFMGNFGMALVRKLRSRFSR